VWVPCGTYKSSYNISNMSYLNSPLVPFSFMSPSSHSWNSFNRHHSSIYIHVYTIFALYSPSHTLSPPLPTSTNLPGMICSALLFKDYIKKKPHFCLFKIATQGVSLWHFHDTCVITQPVHFLYFSSFYLSPLLIVALKGLKILYSFFCREYNNHIQLLSFLLFPSCSHM
jgi:hypothetical protein